MTHVLPTAEPVRGFWLSHHAAHFAAAVPGIALCGLVSCAAVAGQIYEEHVFGQPYLEALVLAILIGVAVRTSWTPPPLWRTGIDISSKFLLEIAVTLLGASVSLQAVAAAGPLLLAGIAGIVASSLAGAYAIGRLLGLSPRMAVLIAAGNSICGNSAIAAVAPVIGADPDEIAGSIAFTAILGVLVVLGLKFLVPLLGLTLYGYGVLAGLTVYAVPQVLAATIPLGGLSTQVGTLVKLVRVLMLGPVVLGLSFAAGRRNGMVAQRLAVQRLVPWFIVGFILLAALRSFGLVPPVVRAPLAAVTSLLTVVSMAALGLGVDVRVLRRVGGRASATVTLSLLFLIAISLGLVRILGV